MGMLDCESADEERKRREDCCKLLLDTGSDISSVDFRDYNYTEGWYLASAFSLELLDGTLVRRSSYELVRAKQLIILRPR